MRFCSLLVAILAITFIYMSCSKHTVQKSNLAINKILNGWSHSTSPESRTQFVFDEVQNVIREETDNDISSYQFLNDSVIIREFNKEENRYVYEFRGRLDDQRRLVSGIATSSYISNTPDTVQHVFKYDQQGHLLSEVRLSSLSDTFLINYEYEDNMVKKVSTYTNNVLYNIKEFTYYENNLSYHLPEDTKFRKNVNNLVGRTEQKLIKKIVSTGKNGKKKYTLNYEYQTDANGYASKMISKKGKKVDGITTFHYEQRLNYSQLSIAINNNK